jgi:hypothetical protein
MAVGDCVASASRGAYWAGGATIGPMIAFAHRAANGVSHEPVKEPQQLAASVAEPPRTGTAAKRAGLEPRPHWPR